MKLLATIREKDIDPSREQLPDEAHVNHRKAVKIVLFDNEGQIALVHWPPLSSDHPFDGYMLPGGGIDDGEDVMTALHREALEETGCQIKDIEELGYTIEYMSQKGKLYQETYIFSGRVDGPKGELQLTERERSRQMGVVWKTPTEALELVKNPSEPSFGAYRSVVALEALQFLGNLLE